MANTKQIDVYGNRGQGVFLVLYALRECGGPQSKQEVLRYIQQQGLYEITRHDLPPYHQKDEPKYQTLLSWARKDALEHGWLLDHDQRDMWHLSREGREILDTGTGSFRSKEWAVGNCYLWTAKFKRLIDPDHISTAGDRTRPEVRLDMLREKLGLPPHPAGQQTRDFRPPGFSSTMD